MEGRRYVVQPGDSLWKIAKAELGCGSQWPRIFKYNNRREVSRSVHGGIDNPDIIYPGQTLLIPTLGPGFRHARSIPEPSNLAVPPPVGAARPAREPQKFPVHRTLARHHSTAASLRKELEQRQTPKSFKFKLDDAFPKGITIDSPGVSVEFKWSGDVILMSQKSYPVVHEVAGVKGSDGLELQHQMAANQALDSLINDVRLNFNPKDGKLSLRTMLASADKMPATHSAIGLTMDAGKPVKLRYELSWPKVESTTPTGRFKYYALTLKAVVELTVHPPVTPTAAKKLEALKTDHNAWNTLLGLGIAGGTVFVVLASIVEDFFPIAGGVGNDPATAMLATGLIGGALEKLRRTPQRSLPQALVPANGRVRMTFDVPDA